MGLMALRIIVAGQALMPSPLEGDARAGVLLIEAGGVPGSRASSRRALSLESRT